MRARLCIALVTACAACAAAACGNDGARPPDRDPTTPTDLAPGRRIKRLTADQFARSLQVATGQTWSRYATYAGALGKADWSEITEEGVDIGVTFDKLVTDAARETCGRAVNATDQAILRYATAADRPGVDGADAKILANLKYLMLRFLGEDISADDDPRLAPWLGLLHGGTPPATDAAMRQRWVAVCIGLVTHPDFLTY
ncbi:MAG TPA: hypothetical protein VHE35_11145 [Kofleriaceae bacterium]|nr:hypothetical protein [Kofleriaceae bacterium]